MDNSDLDSLLARLRHESTHLRQWANPTMQPFLTAWNGEDSSGSAREDSLVVKLLSRAGALAAIAFCEGDEFIAVGYRFHFARATDPEGLRRARQRLASATPRTEMWLEWRVSDEAQERNPLRGWRGLATRLLWRCLRGRDVASLQRVMRAVLRRVERWASQRVAQHRVGAALLVARDADARHEGTVRAAAILERRIQSNLTLREQEAAQALERLDARIQEAAQAQALREQEAVQALKRLDARITELAFRITAATAQNSGGSDAASGSLLTPPAQGSKQRVTAYLWALEQHFRGKPEKLEAQLRQDHLPMLLQCREEVGDGPCLDIGCGRGVWLGVLADAGFQTRGVDMSPNAVSFARNQGLDAEMDDAVAWLQRQPEASALAVTAMHVLEHLPLATRLALLAEAARVLKPGGVLIAETPNPENIWVATHTFHHDPTHTQPLTPEGLAFMVGHAGLEVTAVQRLHPYPDEAALAGTDALTSRLNHMTCGAQDFAVVARKPVHHAA